jgi:hypothetical protein
MVFILIITILVMAGLFVYLARAPHATVGREQETGPYIGMLLAFRILAVLLAVVASVLSLGLFMAELVVHLWLVYAISAFFIGACVPRAWYLAVVISWLPIVLAPESASYLMKGASLDSLMFTMSPLAALVGGYLGSRSARRWLTSFRRPVT